MSNPINTNVPAVLSLPAESFAKLRKLQGEQSAIAKEIDAIKLSLGIPDALSLAKQLHATPDNGAQAVIVDGNGSPMGKLSVYWRNEFQVKAGYCTRIS